MTLFVEESLGNTIKIYLRVALKNAKCGISRMYAGYIPKNFAATG